jgi:hypothetical protein
MSTENKPAARKYRPWADPNIPFGLAIILIVSASLFTLEEGWVIEAPVSYIFLGIAFIILRFIRSGWWRILRTIVFVFYAPLFIFRLTAEVYPSSAVDPIIFPALFILMIWLYLT